MSPEGLVFEFGDYASARRIGKRAQSLFDPICRDELALTPNPTRTVTYMDAQRLVDLHGNWIEYEYQDFGTPIAPWTMPGGDWIVRGYEGPECASIVPRDNERPSLLLRRITSSDGRSVELTYSSADGRLETITDIAGRSWSYTYHTFDDDGARFLESVSLPHGSAWLYQYGLGAFNEQGTQPAARKLKKLTYPTGGQVSFEYETYSYGEWIYNCDMPEEGAPPPPTWVSDSGIRVKSTMSSSGANRTYSYSRGGVGVYDVTTVTGPEGSTLYKFMGAGFSRDNYEAGCAVLRNPFVFQNNAWQIGQLMEKVDPTGDKTVNVWQSRLIYPGSYYVFDLGYVWDQNYWVPQLAKRTITRDGLTYVAEYLEHDAHGNPKKVMKTGPTGAKRSVNRTYYIDTGRNILHRLKDESVVEIVP